MKDPLSRPFSPASFDQFLEEKRLMGSRCTNCNTLFLPPRAICPRCHKEHLEWVEMGRKGVLAAFTSIAIAPTFMLNQGYGREKPYLTGIVELEEGVKVSARISGLPGDDPDAVEIGAPMQAIFIDIGEGSGKKTQLAFEPVK